MNSAHERFFSVRDERPVLPPVFLLHGSLFERNGVTDLLEAFAQVKRLRPKSEPWLIGTGDFLPTLMSLVQSLQLGHAVRVSGEMLPARTWRNRS